MNFANFTPLISDPEQFRAPPNPERDAFEALYQQWETEWDSSLRGRLLDPSWPYTRSAYGQIMAMGKAAIPFIVEKIALGNFFLNWTLEDITGISPPMELRRQGEQTVSRWWLARYELLMITAGIDPAEATREVTTP